MRISTVVGLVQLLTVAGVVVAHVASDEESVHYLPLVKVIRLYA